MPEFDYITYLHDISAFKEWEQSSRGGNEQILNRLKIALKAAIVRELSETQKKYMVAYYVDGLTMQKVADTYCVDRTTVSKTLNRARRRLNHILRYVDPSFINVEQPKRNKRMR